MSRATSEISYDQAEQWAQQLGLTWADAVRAASIDSEPRLLRMRWRNGKAGNQPEKLIATLAALEAKRREPTPTGARIKALDTWERLGLELAGDLPTMEHLIEQISPMASAAARTAAAREAVAKAEEAQRAASIGFTRVTPAPRKPRR